MLHIAIWAFAFSMMLFLFLGFWSERGMIWNFQSGLKDYPGLDRSLESVFLSSGFRRSHLPRLFIFSDPIPQAFGFRSMGGRGTILISQGLIAALSYDDLLTLIGWCGQEIRAPGAWFRTLCALLAFWYLGWERGSCQAWPYSSGQTVSLLSAIAALLIFPIGQLLLRWGQIDQKYFLKPWNQKGCLELYRSGAS